MIRRATGVGTILLCAAALVAVALREDATAPRAGRTVAPATRARDVRTAHAAVPNRPSTVGGASATAPPSASVPAATVATAAPSRAGEPAPGTNSILALQRASLAGEASAATLLDAAERADSADERADLLEALRVDGATDVDLARTTRFLIDPAPIVRASVARTLAQVDPGARATVRVALARARSLEREPAVRDELDDSLARLDAID